MKRLVLYALPVVVHIVFTVVLVASLSTDGITADERSTIKTVLLIGMGITIVVMLPTALEIKRLRREIRRIDRRIKQNERELEKLDAELRQEESRIRHRRMSAETRRKLGG